jgi:hypothetical protein
MLRPSRLTSRFLRSAFRCFVCGLGLGGLVLLVSAPASAQLLVSSLSLGARPWDPSCVCANAPGPCSGDTYDQNLGPHEFALSRVWLEVPLQTVPIRLDWPAGWAVLGYEICYGTLVSGDPGVRNSQLVFSFPDCPAEDRPFLRIWLDCSVPGTLSAAPDSLQACGGYPWSESLGLWVDIGDFCGRTPHGHCYQCKYPEGRSAEFTPTSLAVTLPPGGVYVDTVMVSGDTGPECGGLPECGCDGSGACFGGVESDSYWLTAELLDYVEWGGHEDVHCRVAIHSLGMSPGTYTGRITAPRGCCCAANCLPVTVNIREPSAAPASEAPAGGFWISPPGPNPTRGAIAFDLRMTEPGQARAAIFDAGGRRVAEIFDRTLAAGVSRQSWNPSAGFARLLPSGAYFLRVEAGSEQATRMFLVTR